MVSLYYSAHAKKDLIDIGFYVAERNLSAAHHLITEIRDACEGLKDFPSIGQSRNDIRPEMRHRVVSNYLILYRIDNETVEIVRIVHASRHLSDLL